MRRIVGGMVAAIAGAAMMIGCASSAGVRPGPAAEDPAVEPSATTAASDSIVLDTGRATQASSRPDPYAGRPTSGHSRSSRVDREPYVAPPRPVYRLHDHPLTAEEAEQRYQYWRGQPTFLGTWRPRVRERGQPTYWNEVEWGMRPEPDPTDERYQSGQTHWKLRYEHRIVSIEGRPVSSQAEVRRILARASDRPVRVLVEYPDGSRVEKTWRGY